MLCGRVKEILANLKIFAKFQTMRTQTLKKSTIQSVFRNTELIPYHPEVGLPKVRTLP